MKSSKEKLNNSIDNTNEQTESTIEIFIKDYFAIFITSTILICSGIGYYSEYNLLKEFNINILGYVEIDDFFLAGLKQSFIIIGTVLLLAISLLTLIYIFELLRKLNNVNIASKIHSRHLSDVKSLQSEEEARNEKIKFLIEERKKFNSLRKIYLRFLELIKGHNLNNLLHKSNNKINTSVQIVNVANELIISKKKFNRLIIIAIIGMLLTLLVYGYSIHKLLETSFQIQLDRIILNPVSMATIHLKNKTTLPDSSNQPLVFVTSTSKFMFFFQHGSTEKTSIYAMPISSIINVHYSDFKIVNDQN